MIACFNIVGTEFYKFQMVIFMFALVETPKKLFKKLEKIFCIFLEQNLS